MFGISRAMKMIGVCAGKNNTTSIRGSRAIISITGYLFGIILSGFIFVREGNAAVNVYLPTPALQSQFVADTTSQWNGTFATGLFSGSMTLNLTSKKTSGGPIDPKLVSLDSISNKLVAISTVTFIDGYALGMIWERNDDASFMGGQLGFCDTPEHFGLATIDSTTCNAVAGYMSNYLVVKDSGLAIVPDVIK